jgi:hypothetical protein
VCRARCRAASSPGYCSSRRSRSDISCLGGGERRCAEYYVEGFTWWWVVASAFVGWVAFAVGSHFYETADASAAGDHS